MQDIDSEKILNDLKKNLKSFKDSSEFCTEPGIYAVGFIGKEFPLYSAHIKQNDIIYIGKSETNQILRDVKTHFESGKSGSSTLRRSLGAILRKELKLIPIPRSCTENSPTRFTNYKFTSESEVKLTEWMINNLSLSYCKVDKLKSDLGSVEEKIIMKTCPILNLQNNPNKQFLREIKNLRKDCRNLAERIENIYK